MDEYSAVSSNNLVPRLKRRNIRIICLSVVLIATVILAVTLGLTLGTTSSGSLKETIINNCTTYLKDNGATSQNDCEKIWDSFTQAFVGKNPCEVRPDAYDSLIHSVSQVSQEPTCNRMLFWSGTKEDAHAFAKNCSYLTLEDTLLGSLLDGLTWCGKKESQEIYTTGCPNRTVCLTNPVQSFWDRSSAAFAESACGDVFVMLNGSMPYNPSSTFARVEVKYFTSKMKSLTVLLVTEEEDTKLCGSESPSLKNLKADLDQQKQDGKLNPEFQDNCDVVPPSKLQTCIVH